MNILVTNDDGIFARGIHLLTKGFEPFEEETDEENVEDPEE